MSEDTNDEIGLDSIVVMPEEYICEITFYPEFNQYHIDGDQRAFYETLKIVNKKRILPKVLIGLWISFLIILISFIAITNIWFIT